MILSAFMASIRRCKQKKLFPKYQLIRILRLQVMHDYVLGIAPKTRPIVLKYVSYETLVKIAFNISHWNEFCLIPLGKCASWRRTKNKSKRFRFLKFLRVPSIWHLGVCEHPVGKLRAWPWPWLNKIGQNSSVWTQLISWFSRNRL